MARNQIRSRRPLRPQIPEPERPEPVDDRRLKMRRAGVDRRIPNPVALPKLLYGFLAAIEGDAPGPWFLSFECTDQQWFNDTIDRHMVPPYDHSRLRQVLNGQDYHSAWSSSIAARVVLRHIGAAYLEAMSNRPPPLSLYRCAVDDEQLRGFGLQDPSERGGPALQLGYWYGLELLSIAFAQASLDPGMLINEDPNTGEFQPPAAYRLLRLRNLRWRAARDRDFIFDYFHSQATMLALHYARGL